MKAMSRLGQLLVPPQVRRVARKRGVTKARVADEFHTFIEVKPSPGRWKVAAHITCCVTLAILTIAAVAGPAMALLSVTGTFVCTISLKRAWRHRVTILLGLSAGYVVSLALGSWASGDALLTTLVLTGLTGVSVLVYHALVGDPPGPIMLPIGASIATYLPTTGMPWQNFVVASGSGAVLASVFSLLLQLPNRHSPEDSAVQDATDAVEEYLASDPDGDFVETGRLRDCAYGSIFNASYELRAAVGAQRRSSHWVELQHRLREMHIAVVKRTADTRLDHAEIAVPVMQQADYLGRPRRRYLLRWGLSAASLPSLVARRASVAVFLTCVIAYGIGVQHPYWAVLTTALLVSLNTDKLSLTHRALHRFVGTCAGVGLFYIVARLHLGEWGVLIFALVCVYLLQWTVVRNFAFGAAFITPMALLIASSGPTNRPLGALMTDRIFETALSSLICVVVVWSFGRRLPILLVRRQFRRALRALETVLILIADGKHDTPEGLRARRDLIFEQLEAAHVLQIGAAELPHMLSNWDEVEANLNSCSYVTLAACWTGNPLDHLDADAMERRLARLINALPPVSTDVIDGTLVAGGLADVLAVGGAKMPHA